MRVYQSDEKFILAVEGGEFREFTSEPKAIILNQPPVPTRMWNTPTEVDENPFSGEEWEYKYDFREFLCDGQKVIILEISCTRYIPGNMFGKAEFFVDSAYAHRKIESLRSSGNIAGFIWDPSTPTWIEIERGFKYEYE